MEVWFDNIVIATEYTGPVNGEPRAEKKTTPSKSALLTRGLLIAEPGKTAFKETIDGQPDDLILLDDFEILQ